MSMVEFGNNLDLDEEFDVLHNILDFPLECLEGDEDAEDWDISNPECLGPIPSNVLMGPPISDDKSNFRHPALFPRPVAPIAGVSELKQLPKRVDASDLHILPLRKLDKVQESPSFRMQSPVSVLESSGSGPKDKSLSIKSDNVIPVRSRSKRIRYAGINPWLLAAHGLPTSKPAPDARSRGSRKILCQQPFAIDLPKTAHSLDVSDPAHLQNTSKKCSHCQSTKTPQWRWGPLGKNTLCNACGVRYRSGRLFPEYRPAASPTFAQSQHSNSHRKVTEMRNKANILTAQTKLAPLSPKTEAKVEELSIALQMEAKIMETPSAQLEVHTVRAPEGKQLTKHDDTSSLHVHPQIAGSGTPTRKQLAKHVDTSGSLSSPQIVGAPKRKKLANSDDTCSSHTLLQYRHATVQESGSFCAENHVSLLENRVPCLRERWLSFVSSRSKHIKPTCENLLLLASPSPSPCRKTSDASKGKERGKRLFQPPAAMDILKDSPKNYENLSDVSGPAGSQTASKHGHVRTKKCAHCQSTKTPQWRQGPLGPRTLCNACGVRYRSGRLVPEYRPAASPTFVPSKHSNLHSEIVQMIKAEHTSLRRGAKTKVPLTSHPHSQRLFHDY